MRLLIDGKRMEKWMEEEKDGVEGGMEFIALGLNNSRVIVGLSGTAN
jgi:hypothetical protein